MATCNLNLSHNLNADTRLNVVQEEYLRSYIEPGGINFIEALRYIAITNTKETIQELGHKRITTKRRFKRGTVPGIRNPINPKNQVEDQTVWVFSHFTQQGWKIERY